jgi:hypothetical protein
VRSEIVWVVAVMASGGLMLPGCHGAQSPRPSAGEPPLKVVDLSPKARPGEQPPYYLFDKPLEVDAGLGDGTWRDELKMTAKQRGEADRLRKVGTDAYAMRMDARAAGRPQAEQDALLEKQLQSDRDVLAMLDAKQKSRLFELQLQRRGLSYAASHKTFVDRAGLSEPQLVRIWEITRTHSKERGNLHRKFNIEMEAFRIENAGRWPRSEFTRRLNAHSAKLWKEKFNAEIKDRAEEAAEHFAVLTPEQRRIWKSMLGLRFVETFQPVGVWTKGPTGENGKSKRT